MDTRSRVIPIFIYKKKQRKTDSKTVCKQKSERQRVTVENPRRILSVILEKFGSCEHTFTFTGCKRHNLEHPPLHSMK